MSLNISVIIPTINRPQSLKQTLDYIAKAEMWPSQIIVVDQSPKKQVQIDNKKIISSYEGCLDILYDYQELPSLTRARNRGLELAKEEIIVFSDDDVDVRADTFSNINRMMQDPSLAMIGGFNEGDKKFHNSIMGYLFLRSSFRKRNQGHVSLGMYGKYPLVIGERIVTEWAMGFFFVVRKSLINKWQCHFDENLKFYAYAEDLDFTYGYYLKACKESLNCVMSDLLTVRHNVSKEYRTPKLSVTIMEMVHREYLAYKYRNSIGTQFALWWSNMGTFMFRFLRRECPFDVLAAIKFVTRHRLQIRQGNFMYEKFMNL